MKKFRLFALLLALAMVVSLFAGCGQDEPTTTPDAPTTDQPNTSAPSEPTPSEPAKAEKIYRTYTSTDTPMMNTHDYTNTEISTTYEFVNSPVWRAVPDEDGIGYHYIGDLATDLPELIETQENMTYTKYVAEKQEDGSTKYIPTEETATLTTWQFKIRDEAVWHNGEKLDANDVSYSWKMQMDPVMLNQMSNFIYNQAITIYNGEKFFRGDCEWEEVGVKVLEDGQTMQVICVGTPDVTVFCSHFADRSTYPVYDAYYEAGMNDDRSATTYGATLDEWMGCGPYYFSEWEPGNKQVFKKNPDHWLADLFNYDVVEYYVIEENNAAMQMFEAGKLDDYTPNADSIEIYVEDPRTVSYPSTSVYHIDINDGSSPIKNEENPVADTIAWRKAIYHALDRETIAKEFFGFKEPAGWYVNGQAGLLSESGLTFRESEYGQKIEQMVADWSAEGHTTGYNPELARKYLQEAYAEKGLPADTKIKCIFLYSETSETMAKTVQWLQPQFEEIFEGLVQLELSVFPSELGTSNAKKQYAWDLNYNDWARSLSRTYPYECFYYFTTGYGSHPNYYLSERYDALFDFARTTQDLTYEEQLKATYDLEMVYLEEVVTCPIIQSVQFTVFSEHLQLPVKTYIPGFGWGAAYGDIVE